MQKKERYKKGQREIKRNKKKDIRNIYALYRIIGRELLEKERQKESVKEKGEKEVERGQQKERVKE